MPTYEALIDIPWYNQSELERFVEQLRETAYPRFSVVIEAKSKADAASQLAESTSVYWNHDQYDKDWWMKKLRPLSGRELELKK